MQSHGIVLFLQPEIQTMRLTILSLALILSGIFAKAQNPTTSGKKIIDNLCGCFEVDFKYAETFSPDGDYKYHDRDETGGTAELALPIEVSEKKIVIQHLLIVSPKMVVKHWREEWTYENPVIWKYQGNKTWVKEILPPDQVKGKWTQTVWEVSDEPRYQGISQFVEMDGKIIWQSTSDAPLPRREYTVRNDYDVLRRTNRMNITDSGYVHEQDNKKIVKRNGEEKLLVEEKGLNTYKRINETECAQAKEYWEKNKEFWAKVRKVWTSYVDQQSVISLETKVDGKFLHEYLLNMASTYTAGNAGIDREISTVISKFVRKESVGINR